MSGEAFLLAVKDRPLAPPRFETASGRAMGSAAGAVAASLSRRRAICSARKFCEMRCLCGIQAFEILAVKMRHKPVEPILDLAGLAQPPLDMGERHEPVGRSTLNIATKRRIIGGDVGLTRLLCRGDCARIPTGNSCFRLLCQFLFRYSCTA